MKQERFPARAALMLSAAALLATPAIAQVAAPADQAAPVTPPPVVSTAPQGGAPAGASSTPVNAEAAAQAAAEDAERRTQTRAARRNNAVTRSAVRRTNAPVAPATPEPAPAPPPPPPEAQNAPAQTAPTPAEDPTAVTEVGNTTAATEQPQDQSEQQAAEPTPAQSGPPMWPLALLALLVVVGGVWFLLSRRRKAAAEDEWATAPLAAEPVVHHEPVIERPVAQEAAHPAPLAPVVAAAPLADPVAADVSDVAPVVAENTSVEEPHADDVAALTAATNVGDRPWLEFAMRPVRAGTSADEALVEIELTVANAGNMVAEDVRISTFMLPAGNDGDLDQMLVKGDDSVTPQTIAAGEGTRVDATLAMTRASLPDCGTFQPVVVADARYRLPDGGEGRTSAAFLVGGLAEDGTTIQPIDLEGRMIREDVSAQLYRDPVRV